jgi:hypothetical protein
MVEGYGLKNLDLAKETEIKFKIGDFNYLSASLSVSISRFKQFPILKMGCKHSDNSFNYGNTKHFDEFFSCHKHNL